MSDGPVAWIFLVVGLVFIFGGSKRLEDLGKGFGSFMWEFNKAKRDADDQIVASGTGMTDSKIEGGNGSIEK